MNIIGVPPEAWFPVITLVIGATLKAVFDAFADRRIDSRSREARAEQRLDSIRLKRAEFQRTTLLELQEVVAQHARFAGQAHHQDMMAARSSGVWGRQLLTDEVNDGIHKTQVRLALLKERVRDEKIRQLAELFVADCVAAGLAKSEADATNYMFGMRAHLTELQKRIGLALRSLDDDEDRLLERS